MIPLLFDVLKQDKCALDCGGFAHGVVGFGCYSCAESFS
jgi:hypothetical protein